MYTIPARTRRSRRRFVRFERTPNDILTDDDPEPRRRRPNCSVETRNCGVVVSRRVKFVSRLGISWDRHRFRTSSEIGNVQSISTDTAFNVAASTGYL